MAPITKVNPKFVSPKGYEEVIRGIATAAIGAGDPVMIDASVTPDARYDTAFKKAVSEAFIHGVATKPAVSGGVVEVLLQGEMDGFSGMTPGDPVYAESGVLGTTAPTDAVIQIIAVNPRRIRIRI